MAFSNLMKSINRLYLEQLKRGKSSAPETENQAGPGTTTDASPTSSLAYFYFFTFPLIELYLISRAVAARRYSAYYPFRSSIFVWFWGCKSRIFDTLCYIGQFQPTDRFLFNATAPITGATRLFVLAFWINRFCHVSAIEFSERRLFFILRWQSIIHGGANYIDVT